MRAASGTTASEKKLVCAAQAAMNEEQDNSWGPATMVSAAIKLGAACWPLTIKLYNCPVIVCKDIVPLAAKGKALSGYANAISGSFAYNDGSGPASILYADGKAVRSVSCHYYDGKYPESVIFRRMDGTFGLARIRTLADITSYGVGGVRWAVGGMGLLDNYNPGAEGFKGAFSDVLRKTAHTVLGARLGMVYLVYLPNRTAAEVNAVCRQLHLEYAIMLDGGHIAAINGDESFARINRGQAQQYIIQAR